MATFFDELKRITLENKFQMNYVTDIPDELRKKICDLHLPLHEWEKHAASFLDRKQSFPSSNYSPFKDHDYFGDFSKMYHEGIQSFCIRFDDEQIKLSSNLSKLLSYEIWSNRTKCYGELLQGIQDTLLLLQQYADLLKLLACIAFVELHHIPRLLDSISRRSESNPSRASNTDIITMKSMVDHVDEIYSSLDAHPGYDIQGLVAFCHDSLYNTAKRCALLPSRLHVDNVRRIDQSLVAGGGFADVYKGRIRSGQLVALKVPRNFGTPEQVQKVQAEICKEALVWNHSEDENILPLLGVSVSEGIDDVPGPIILITPWMHNGSLKQFLLRNPETDRRKMIRGIASGLLYLHWNRKPPVVHGDLRCDNIPVDDSGKPRIADFGLSRVEAMQASLTGTSLARGSLRWQAPELLMPDTFGGNGKHTFATDIYAFGMTCYEIFTDKVPFYGLTDPQAMFAIARGQIPDKPDPIENGRGLTERKWQAMVECWNSDAKERPMASLLRLWG